MLGFFRLCAALWLAMVLVGCGGGGDSSVTKVTGAGLNTLGQSPAVSLNAVQTDNNLLVSVSDGPRGFQLAPNANLLYATVRVCHPVSGQCVDIDHVQVDTGSVGLRVLASKVKALNLPPVQVLLTTNSPQLHNAYECYPFVIGGLWGPTVTAVVGLGRQLTSPVAVHLIEDNTKAVEALQAPDNCVQAAGQVMSDAGSLGSNGILGIGSTTLDCGDVCVGGTYGANDFVQYYGYPPGSTGTAQCGTDLSLCSIAKVPPNLQVYNPISKFANSAYRGGVVLAMPAVTGLGAAAASGELIFGVDTIAGGSGLSSNIRPANATKVMLGVDPTNNMDAYLNVTTTVTQGGTPKVFASSYLDTGTNGLFFTDPSIARCVGSVWYCPKSTLTLSAVLTDGGSTVLNQTGVQFQVGNAEALFSTSNTAFSSAAGAAPNSVSGANAFAWGMPFFYGRRVYLSIWDIDPPANTTPPPPWYAWTTL